MEELRKEWSQSQKLAFGFARRGISDGLSGREALKQYRSGGGKIGNEYWFSIYKTAYNIDGWKETIQEVPMTYQVRENMFTSTGMDFREEYIMQMKVSGYSEELGIRVNKWVTVESDKIITKQEWRWGAQQAVDASLGSPVFVIDRISEYQALKRETTGFV